MRASGPEGWIRLPAQRALQPGGAKALSYVFPRVFTTRNWGVTNFCFLKFINYGPIFYLKPLLQLWRRVENYPQQNSWKHWRKRFEEFYAKKNRGLISTFANTCWSLRPEPWSILQKMASQCQVVLEPTSPLNQPIRIYEVHGRFLFDRVYFKRRSISSSVKPNCLKMRRT